MGKTDKRPSLQFYPGDWKKDPAVTCLSLQSKGLWLEMLLLMFESPERGYLKHASGNPIGDEQLARMVGASVQEVRKCLAEMKLAGTYSVSDDGIIFCRRMVRDEQIAKIRRDAGKLGGNPKLKGEVGTLLNQNNNQIPTPSSSSSISVYTPTPFQANQKQNQTSDAGSLDEIFERIWIRHPKRQSKGLAEFAFTNALSPAPNRERLAEQIEFKHAELSRSEQWTKSRGKYAPLLHNWLNAKGWLDELPEAGSESLEDMPDTDVYTDRPRIWRDGQ